MNKDKVCIIKECIKHAKILDETQKNGDFKKGNRSSKILFQIRDQLMQDKNLGSEVLDELLKSDAPSVLNVCCVFALVMDYRTEEAITILKKIAESGIKMTSFTAETTLKLYETGELFELHGKKK